MTTPTHYGPSPMPIDTIPAYRAAEIESRRHTFNVDTPARRRERRGVWIGNILFAILIAALIAVWYIETFSSPSVPGAVTTQLSPASGAPLTPETAPVRWQRKDFATSLERVAPATNKARRGASQPASGSVLKRKGASK